MSSFLLLHEVTILEPHVYKNFGSRHDKLKKSAILKVTPHSQNGKQKQAEDSRFLG